MNSSVTLFKDYYEAAIIIGAISAAIIVLISKIVKRKKKVQEDNITSPKKQDVSDSSGNFIQGNNNSIVYATASSKNDTQPGDKMSKSGIQKKDEIKINKKILFIDDNPYSITKLMQKNGWRHVNLVPEIDSFECDEVKSADVILVDIIGVGKNLGFKDQGYELAEALKETYPDKKIIIYSQEKNNFHKAIKKVDLTIEKTSNIYLLEKEILSLFGVHND